MMDVGTGNVRRLRGLGNRCPVTYSLAIYNFSNLEEGKIE